MKSTEYMTNILKLLSQQLTYQKQLYKKITAELLKYPPGNIVCYNHNNSMQYRLRKNSKEKNGSYISKKDQKTIQRFLQKKYYTKSASLLESKIKLIEQFINQASNLQNELQNIYSLQPIENKKFISPIDMSASDFIKSWIDIPYTPKPISQELPCFKTNNGELVRSKSELNIANLLLKYNIPYKYECPLILGGTTIHPDFTILDVNNRREIYWEHRGMMDHIDYARHSISRIKTYEKNNLFIGEQVIVTEETSTLPLDTENIERIIRHHLLA